MVETVAIIVPAFNEEKHLGKVLTDIIAATRKINRSRLFPRFQIQDIIVVDDGSKDRTFDIARKKRVKVVHLDRNYGKSFAFYKGVEEARKQNPGIVVTLDADLASVSAEQIQRLVNPILKKKAKMVVARYTDPIDPFWKALGVRPSSKDSERTTGERAIQMDALDPLFNRNQKWENFFGIKDGRSIRRAGFGLEIAFNHLIPNKKAVAGFKKARPSGIRSRELDRSRERMRGVNSQILSIYEQVAARKMQADELRKVRKGKKSGLAPTNLGIKKTLREMKIRKKLK